MKRNQVKRSPRAMQGRRNGRAKPAAKSREPRRGRGSRREKPASFLVQYRSVLIGAAAIVGAGLVSLVLSLHGPLVYTWDNYEHVHKGMTKAQVDETMISFPAIKQQGMWVYYQSSRMGRRRGLGFSSTHTFVIWFQSDRVVGKAQYTNEKLTVSQLPATPPPG